MYSISNRRITFIVWCEDEEGSMLFKVERKQSKDIRQRSAVATPSFTPVGELQATDRANLLYAHIDKGAGADLGVVRVVRSNPLN